MQGSTDFEWDAFLSHAKEDKAFVRALAKRLKADGLRVWLDEETIKPGRHIAAEIERGIQRSRTLVFFVSKSALSSEWAKVELHSAIFRDPSNLHRRFVTVLLEDAELPDTLKGYKYIDWRGTTDDESYRALVDTVGGSHKGSAMPLTFHSVFTPGAPPIIPNFFVGRTAQLRELADLLRSPGIHPIVIGPRGVGKTSLVRGAMKEIGYVGSSILEVNTVRDFDECCRAICGDLGVNPGMEPMTGASMLRILRTIKVPSIVSVDELDDLPSNSTIRKDFARFAKAASNQAADLQVKFIFSGIGSDAHDLFGGHDSSFRNFPQIQLNPLNEDDFLAFLDSAAKLLNVRIAESVKSSLATGSDGFPYYFHQVGFHAFAACSRDPHAHSVSDRHLEEGRQAALDAAFTHYLRRYKFTIYRLSEIELAVLAEAVESFRMRFPFEDFAKSVEHRASANGDAVRSAIRSLHDQGYLRYRKADNTLVLADPLLKPFLRIKLRLPLAALARRRRTDVSEDQPDLF